MIGKALLAAITGYAVVFFGLILLMCVVIIMGKIMADRRAKNAAPAAGAIAPPAADAPVRTIQPTAPGSAGELKLYDTDPKTAAMIMAIVANELKTPLNELRFKSIKEVK